MAFFAQLDNDNVCIGILDLLGNPNDPLYYPIASYDLRLLGREYIGNGDNSQQATLDDFGIATGSPYNPSDLDNPNNSITGSCLKFPETIVDNSNLNLKGNRMTTYNTDHSSFWSYFGSSDSHEYWDSTLYYATNNTNFQTIVEIEGEGIITNIICPSPVSTNSTITVQISLDGVLYEFISRDVDYDRRYCLGYFAPDYDSNQGHGHGHDDDNKNTYPASSWKEADREMFVLIPPTALQRGQSGLKFKESMKIDIQSSSGWSTSGRDEYAGASYLTYIPFGV